MNQAHSKEPWEAVRGFRDVGQGDNYRTIDDDYLRIYTKRDKDTTLNPAFIEIYGPNQEANAALIVACVNACAGIKNPLAVPALLEACEAALKYNASIAGKAIRDEVEIKEGLALATGDDLDALYFDWMSKARTAIAKAKGESA